MCIEYPIFVYTRDDDGVMIMYTENSLGHFEEIDCLNDEFIFFDNRGRALNLKYPEGNALPYLSSEEDMREVIKSVFPLKNDIMSEAEVDLQALIDFKKLEVDFSGKDFVAYNKTITRPSSH